MRNAKLLAGSALSFVLATAALAQDMGRHDNGTGGAGATGAGMMRGTSSFNEDPYYTAVRLIHHEKYADAIPYLDAALADRPTSAKLLAFEGFTHTKLGEYGQSLDYLKKAIASDPDHKPAHQYLGELYLALHDPGAANGQLTELARICPDGCDERTALQSAIAAYPPAAPATK